MRAMKQRVRLLEWMILCAGVFIGMASTYETAVLVYTDVAVSKYIHSFRNDMFTMFFRLISDIGSIRLYAPLVCLLALYFLIRKRWLVVALLVVSLYGSRYLNFALKSWFERARPDIHTLVTATGYSFPSGHAMNATAFIGFIAYLAITEHRLELRQKAIIITVASLLIFSVTLSRVYLGVHYPTDILAGCAAGGAWLILCILFHQFFSKKTA
ncbi:phosphatase PAP2 family protein [Ectobacillus funiculus]|uniref:phosphatase PAP2 family protein n=1 Tax=Ectobacillus funiculus TaxID=137993 RepID=UPI003CCC787E